MNSYINPTGYKPIKDLVLLKLFTPPTQDGIAFVPRGNSALVAPMLNDTTISIGTIVDQGPTSPFHIGDECVYDPIRVLYKVAFENDTYAMFHADALLIRYNYIDVQVIASGS